ncbi:cytochrome b [Sphingomonas sp.]|uniref:cytochrome b n=1 Tax=Sphingomonas sp. TaxID=28214 RepID=UPI001EC6FC0A|nr:cytochrome b [Sphingomonas sp.]MBX3594595.1 cytochrome b [Sphingomonas sp.]
MAAAFRSDRYTSVAIALHWTLAALILFNLFVGIGHDALPRDWALMPAHKAVGILVLALSLVRLGWRLAHRAPDFAPGVQPWERLVAKVTHWTFYALMIVVPLTGWMLVSGAKTPRPFSFFGLFDVPFLPVGRAGGGFGHEAHEVLGYAMAALVALHVAAALWHQFGRRDGTLGRMIPALKRGA